MYLLFTDETNLPNDPNAKFFAYGALIVPADKLASLDERISIIRREAGYQAHEELKFETNARPERVSIANATAAKQQVIEACIANGCKFIVYVVLHAIARNKPQQLLIEWGANHVIGKFNYFLRTVDAYGIVALDRLASHAEYRLLTERFTKGLTFGDDGGEAVILDRIKLFTSTCINASHASSAMDIALGSFRYCINNPRNTAAAKVMMKNIAQLIWCTRDGDNQNVYEMGLIFRPKGIKVDKYKAEYFTLLDEINSLLA